MTPIDPDCAGGPVVPGDPCCPATNSLLTQILAAVDDLDGNTDAIEALLTAISNAVADLDVNTDGLEACCADGNVILAAILAAVADLDANTDTIEALLTAIGAGYHQEDDVAVNGDVGIAVLGVRNDDDAVQTDTDGDYGWVSVDDRGRAKVKTSGADFAHGQNADIDIAAAEQITATSPYTPNGVLVKALPGNTGIVYVGDAAVTVANGFPLEAGDSVTIPVDDPALVYVATDTDDQGVAWVAA